MVLHKDLNLEELRKQYDCVNWFETGLWDSRNPNVSIKKALKANFDKLFSIEIKKEWVEIGKNIFKQDIESGRYKIYYDDSSYMNKYLHSDDFENKTMFFLDAHVDSNNITGYIKKCPLLEELQAIKTISRKDNIILIDDINIIKNPYPWSETSYGNINFLSKVKDLILSINKDYKFYTIDGYLTKDDILVAYV